MALRKSPRPAHDFSFIWCLSDASLKMQVLRTCHHQGGNRAVHEFRCPSDAMTCVPERLTNFRFIAARPHVGVCDADFAPVVLFAECDKARVLLFGKCDQACVQRIPGFAVARGV